MKLLVNKTVLITGGSRGIGAGIVLDTTYGTTTKVHSAAEVSNIALSSGFNVIYLKYTIGTSAAIQTSVANDSTEALALAALPANTETEVYYPLHCIEDHTENLPAQSSVRLLTHRRQYESGAIKADLYETDGTRDTDLDVTPPGTNFGSTG